MRPKFLLCLWLALAGLLWGNGRLWAQPDADSLAAQLAETEGEARLELLIRLVATTHKDRPAQALDWGTEALRLLASFPDQDRELNLLTDLARANTRLRHYQEALHLGRRAHDLAQAKQEKATIALTFSTLGDVHRARDENTEALNNSLQAAELYRELKDASLLAEVLSDAGVAYSRLSNYQDALKCYFESHQISQESGDRHGIARALNNIGIVYRQLEQYHEALEYYLQALEIQEQNDNLPAVSRLLNNIGIIYRYMGDPDRAIEHYSRSLEIKRQLDDLRGTAATLLNLGMAHEQSGDFALALEHFQRALTGQEEVGNRAGIANALEHIARIERKNGHHNLALANIQRSISIAEEIGRQDDIKDGYQELSIIYTELGRFREALEAFQAYEHQKSEIYNARNSKILAEMQTRFETGRKEREIELLRQAQEIGNLETTRQRAMRHALLIGLGLSSLIILSLYSRYRLKSQSARAIENKNAELELTLADLKASEEHRRRLEKERVQQQERERYISEIEAHNAEIEARNAEMERFTYTVSHDLKSPLVTIRGFLGLLERDALSGDSERLQRDISRIDTAAKHMAVLLDELLQLSRVGRVVNEPEEVSMLELVHEVLDRLAGQLAARGAKIVVAPDLPPAIGDRPRLFEVLQNLVDNGLKFMGDQPEPRVDVDWRQDADEVVYRVSDNGIGVDPRYHHKVFGLFDRLDAQVEGTGVGLALVKRIVEVHHGRVWVESEGLGHGSTFCFTLGEIRSSPDSDATEEKGTTA